MTSFAQCPFLRLVRSLLCPGGERRGEGRQRHSPGDWGDASQIVDCCRFNEIGDRYAKPHDIVQQSERASKAVHGDGKTVQRIAREQEVKTSYSTEANRVGHDAGRAGEMGGERDDETRRFSRGPRRPCPVSARREDVPSQSALHLLPARRESRLRNDDRSTDWRCFLKRSIIINSNRFLSILFIILNSKAPKGH